MTVSSATRLGRLDGLTILRYAHALDHGGGVEQHLSDLNRALGKRNRMTTVQIQFTHDAGHVGETEERLDDSVLVKVPLLVPIPDSTRQDWLAKFEWLSPLKQAVLDVLDLLMPTPALNDFVVRRLLFWRRVPRRPGERQGVGKMVAEILRRFDVDLIVLHSSGGADASEVIDAATRAGIPVALVHHFANARLGGLSRRQQVSRVQGVAGASWIGIPRYLRGSCRNLSDAVDTDFFSAEYVQRHPARADGIVLYAPARMVPEKGQADVLELASVLKQRGLDPRVVFAGRIDSPDFAARLAQLAIDRGISDAVQFLGPLSMEEYRDWYSASYVMVMPTRHHEGMPRTIIDAQAMKVPPIVYDVGGTREGLRDRETGFLVPPGDIIAMADAVESLVRSPELYQRMADAGRKFVLNNYSLQAFAERHEEFYRKLLQRTKAASFE